MSYVFDTEQPERAPIRVLAPHADRMDGQVPRSTLTFFLGDSESTSLPTMSIALSDAWLIVGAGGEDSGLAPDTDPEAAELDNSAANAGAVYVYARAELQAGQLQPRQYLKAPKPSAGDVFGESVALSDSHLVVGAPGDDHVGVDGRSDDAAADSGAVYVYALRDGRFELSEELKAPSPIHRLSGFGASVALSDDRLVVGAPGDKDATGDDASDPAIPGPGVVYVYRLVDDHWLQEQVLTQAMSRAGTGFGWSVRAIHDRIAVGAPFSIGCEDGPDAMVFRGATHLFARDDSGWALDRCFGPSRGRESDLFGYSIGMLDDRLLIGAAWDSSARRDDPRDNSQSYTGAAYLEQRRDDTGWDTELYLKAPDATALDVFGNAVDLSSERAAVGAEQRSRSLTYAGGVYVFRRQSATSQP